MRLHSQCLWTLLVVILLQFVKKNLCQSAATSEPQTDDKSNVDIEPEEIQKQLTESTVENAGIDKSSESVTWDKRGWDKNLAVWGKRRWDAFHTWGKRRDVTDDFIIAQSVPEKKWSEFTLWGKRDSGSTEFQDTAKEKRKQEVLEEPLVVDEQNWPNSDESENNANIKSVVKRSWPQSFPDWYRKSNREGNKREWRGFTTWGKRADYPEIENVDKRKWAKFVSWGKRDDGDDLNEIDKRKWAKFTSWGKRSDQDIYLDAEKRKWAKFTSWGKRDGEVDDGFSEENIDKRRWTQLPVWGKRDIGENEVGNSDKRNWAKFVSWGKRPGYTPNWLALNAWGKRRWSGLRTWGKRSTNNPKAEYLARRLLQIFDTDGDGALDFDELNTYIQILMSLPSKPVKSSDDATQPDEEL